MILQASFQSEWIQKISKSIGKRGDPKLIEKIIYAFALLEQLKLSGLKKRLYVLQKLLTYHRS